MKSVKCFQCGFVGWADTEQCKKCGAVRMPDPNAGSNQTPQTQQTNQPSYHNYSPRGLKKGLATASLVVGILNLCIFGILVIGSIVGIVMAIVARNRVKQYPNVYGGEGLATAGLITNIISIVMIVPIAIIAAIAIPNLLAARTAANEGAAIHVLTKIHAAEATYQATSGNGAFGTLEQLATEGLIDPELASGSHYGYRFTVNTRTSRYNDLPGFQAVGVPLTYGSSGRRSFYIDESGVIRAEDNRGAEATELTPPLNNDGYSSSSPPSRRYNSLNDY